MQILTVCITAVVAARPGVPCATRAALLAHHVVDDGVHAEAVGHAVVSRTTAVGNGRGPVARDPALDRLVIVVCPWKSLAGVALHSLGYTAERQCEHQWQVHGDGMLWKGSKTDCKLEMLEWSSKR